MSNDNLPALLRDPETAYVFARQAADDIERLTRERDDALNELDSIYAALGTEDADGAPDAAIAIATLFKECNSAVVEREAAERKLAMAVEAFTEIEWSNDSEWQSLRAKTALAALEKNDE